MLTSETLKEHAKEDLGIDMLGVANIERFKDAPLDMHPKSIMPNVRSVVVIGERILRGCYRGIDEGTHWPSYQVFGYAGLNGRLGEQAYRVGRFIERHGFEATGVPSSATVREFGPRGPKPSPDLPHREVALHVRIAATLAGLGEMGWSKVFMTKENGPRQRLNIILTEAELEPDPLRIGELCDRCKRCVVECPGGAIPKDKSVSIEVEGQKLEWGDIDLGKCKLTHFGLNRKTSPHLAKRFPGLHMPIAEQEVTWLEAWDLGWTVFPSVPTYKALAQHPIPICGARGCIVGCMKHVEKRDRVDNKFHTKPVFSEETPWSLEEKPSISNDEHHGFVYNPETDADDDEAFAPAPDWY